VLLIRFRIGDGEAQVGVFHHDGVTVLGGVATLADLLALQVARIRDISESPGGETWPPAAVTLLAPADGLMEVWAAHGPELFFKSAAWRVSGPGEAVSVRSDSSLDVPEPGLAVVLNAVGELVGYTICNDLSSRSIEADNPLYRPRAKVNLGGCTVGPGIRPAWEVPDPYALTVELTIVRDGATVWEGSGSTSALHRRIDDLAGYLFREGEFPAGVILSTGACLVTDPPFAVQPGDLIRIRVPGIGELTNAVVRAKSALSPSWPASWMSVPQQPTCR
jgi:2-dehydro-3-deoxy-D-arabinonate dehydratase